MFIIDELRIVVGSMVIGDAHHHNWVEMALLIDARENVDRLRQRLAFEDEFDPTLEIDFLVHTRESMPRRHCPMLEHRLELIEAAEDSLVIEMAYLGDPRFTRALENAVHRGVRVKLVTAAKSDVLGDLNRATCDRLLRTTGAPEHLTIVLLPRMVHAKVVVRDGRFSDIGSANFTPLSHGVYDELNVHVDNVNLARELEGAIDEHCDEGEVADGRVRYRRVYSGIERAIVAYQGRKTPRVRPARRSGRPPLRRRIRST
jgi:phosphatidylserine/phosphatidylglycerophosphate/cardiolipin synthase-like enzyme